jgi:SAM-dependent methyltransferase
MTDYYDELRLGGHESQWAGWRHRLEQALRFEWVLDAVERTGATSLLDVGCGPGALYSYLEATGRSYDYLGIDVYEPAIGHARKVRSRGRFEAWDVFDPRLDDTRFDAVVAIGTLVSGVPVSTPAERVARVQSLWGRLSNLHRDVAVLVCLDQAFIQSRPLLQLEPALLGATQSELEAMVIARRGHCVMEQSPLVSDLTLLDFADPEIASSVVGRDRLATIERVLDGPWGLSAEASERAWLWAEAGHSQRARAVLEESVDPLDELAVLLKERLNGP